MFYYKFFQMKILFNVIGRLSIVGGRSEMDRWVKMDN